MVSPDYPDYLHRVLTAGDHLGGPATFTAGFNVNIEHPLQALCPAMRTWLLESPMILPRDLRAVRRLDQASTQEYTHTSASLSS